MNYQIFDLEKVISTVPNSQYFHNFLNLETMEVGIINLKKDQKDTQQPHSGDEIYYIISGNGTIEIEGIKNNVQPGKIIYIPKNVRHSFHASSNKITALYIISGPF
jgi:mannose-6-phosphate isomerase-like protein (cupin superfamily)